MKEASAIANPALNNLFDIPFHVSIWRALCAFLHNLLRIELYARKVQQSECLMQYLYYFANTSLGLRVLSYLSHHESIKLESVTVIYLIDRWVLRIRLQDPLSLQQDLNFVSFLRENGSPHSMSPRLEAALASLDRGEDITSVMNRYHQVIVSHGAFNPEDIEVFRTTFVEGLGYCPPSLV